MALPIKLESAAVVLVAVLGSRTVGIQMIHLLITHGSKASKLATVSWIELSYTCWMVLRIIEHYCEVMSITKSTLDFLSQQ